MTVNRPDGDAITGEVNVEGRNQNFARDLAEDVRVNGPMGTADELVVFLRSYYLEHHNNDRAGRFYNPSALFQTGDGQKVAVLCRNGEILIGLQGQVENVGEGYRVIHSDVFEAMEPLPTTVATTHESVEAAL